MIKKEIIELRKELGRCIGCDKDYIHPKWWRCGDCRAKILKPHQRPEARERLNEMQRELKELRKELGRCSICDKDYVHPKWVSCGDCREKIRKYHQRPEVKEKQREYKQRPEVKERKKKYDQRPEVKEKQREYQQRPEVKERQREYYKKMKLKKGEGDIIKNDL